jgi:hypothetical protein
MNDSLDSTQPIDMYFQKVDDCVQYAADGRVAFTPDQILQTAYHAISTSGHYNDSCKEWRKKAPIDKTWQNFKRFFAAEYHDLKEQQKVNTSQSNFHGANAATDISNALDNLALAATTDREIVAQLTHANQQLTTTNALLTEQLSKSIATIAQLAKKLETGTNTPNTNTNNGRQRMSRAEWEANLDPNRYCWSHGYRVQQGHTSANCGGKLPGHQNSATRNDIKGGSTKGKT